MSYSCRYTLHSRLKMWPCQIINESKYRYLRKSERRYLIDVIRYLRLLARQGIALQEDANEDNFSQLMLLLSTKDDNITKHLASKKHKYTHREILNELLDLMARQVLSSKVMTIEKNRYFAIMADEYTDKSNKEQ